MKLRRTKSPQKLHIGSGKERLEGWVNIDMQRLPGVDVVADVTRGLDFEGVEAVFAEHFLEHLAIDDALRFLSESHRVLADGAWIRLSTPNLDWVWITHYRLEAESPEKREMAVRLNRAFHGWGHRFVWNKQMLEEALAAHGFEEIRWCRYGESELPVFQNLERHETYGDSDELPHVIIVEARKGAPQPERLPALKALVQQEFLNTWTAEDQPVPQSRSRWAASWVTLLLLLGLAGFLARDRGPSKGTSGPSSQPSGERLNVVLVVVDTLRADHLSGYGYSRATSPNLDAFAQREAVLFEAATSQAACTFPSVNSLLTSRYPSHFLGRPGAAMGIPEEIPSLAEILAAEGYSTLALSASPIVRRSPSRFNPDGGFGRGFEFFGEGCSWKSAACLNERIARQLTEDRKPFFFYLHYMDPHGPYRPPQSHSPRFSKPYQGGWEFIAKGDPNPLAKMVYSGGPRYKLKKSDLSHLVDLYDEEIAFFDAQFPKLLQVFEDAGELHRTVFILTSDHGEAFMENGHIKHCQAPYQHQVAIPLYLRVPGGPGGLRIAQPVENVDVVPTLLDYLGIAIDHRGFEGESLRPLVEAAAAGETVVTGEPRIAFSGQGLWRSAFDGRYKLMLHLRERTLRLYDLVEDPGELREIAEEQPEPTRRLRRALIQWIRDTEGASSASKSIDAAEEAEKRLRALGYLQ